MKSIVLLFSSLLLDLAAVAQVGINTTSPDSSSNLTVATLGSDGNPKGTLLSSMSTAQRTAITAPATGLIVYDRDIKCLMINSGVPAAPVWECIGGSSATNRVYTKHFHYALPSSISKSTTDFSSRTGVTTTGPVTLLSNWLAANDPTQVAQLPEIDKIRLDIVFHNTDQYRPLIENRDVVNKDMIGETHGGITGVYRWAIPTLCLPNGYLNIDGDQVLGWRTSGFLEKSESGFRVLGNDGSYYTATFFGYNTVTDGSGKYNIHLILEKYAPQSGGTHN
jgi:hypothetical protein